MALTEEQVKEYREKLKDGKYIEKAVTGVAGKLADKLAGNFLEVNMPAFMRDVKLNINNTEEKKMARLTLNDHLFETLENLTDKNVKGEDLTEEIRRAGAVAKVAQQILTGQNLMLKATLAAITNGVMDKEAKSKLKLLTE